jgi:hypothetical protein
MMEDVAFLPETAAQSQLAVLAFAGILGGGLVAFEAGRAIKEGDLFKTDAVPANPQAGFVAMTGGLIMFGFMVNETVKQVGWKPLALGSLGIFAFAAVATVARR